MNDFNSRYRNLDDQPDTIRTNAGGFDFNNGFAGGFGGDDMDIMEAENAQKKKQVARASQARSGASKGRKAKKQQFLVYGIIIALEVIALVVIWAMYISYNSKGSSSKKADSKTESQEGSEGGSINVENDNFSLNCSKISITADANGSPVAVVYFTFTNKTESPLSMGQVFNPTFFQNGTELMSASSLAEQPQEIFNKDAQVSNGQSLDCAFAVSLLDTTSEITITMHDNYETFSDIGTTVVPIS